MAKSELAATAYEVLLGECRWQETVVPTRIANLDLLPATLDLAGAVVELATMPHRESRLRAGLAGIETLL